MRELLLLCLFGGLPLDGEGRILGNNCALWNVMLLRPVDRR